MDPAHTPRFNLHRSHTNIPGQGTFVSSEQQPVPVVNLHFAAVAVTFVSAEQQPVPVVNLHFAAVANNPRPSSRLSPPVRTGPCAPMTFSSLAADTNRLRCHAHADSTSPARLHSSSDEDCPTGLPCPCRLHIACSTTLLRRRRLPDRATMPTPTPHRLLC